jgi:hypothetical protein
MNKVHSMLASLCHAWLLNILLRSLSWLGSICCQEHWKNRSTSNMSSKDQWAGRESLRLEFDALEVILLVDLHYQLESGNVWYQHLMTIWCRLVHDTTNSWNNIEQSETSQVTGITYVFRKCRVSESVGSTRLLRDIILFAISNYHHYRWTEHQDGTGLRLKLQVVHIHLLRLAMVNWRSLPTVVALVKLNDLVWWELLENQMMVFYK